MLSINKLKLKLIEIEMNWYGTSHCQNFKWGKNKKNKVFMYGKMLNVNSNWLIIVQSKLKCSLVNSR